MITASHHRGVALRPKAGVVLVAVASLLLVAQPALAADGGVGEGAGSGQETVFTPGQDFGTPLVPFCLEVLASEYVVDVTGAFSAVQGATTAAYTGAARLTFTTLETYFVSPEGTYGRATLEQGCDPTSFGPADPVTTKLVVSDPDNNSATGAVTCTIESDGEATGYHRVNTSFTFTGHGACTVTSAGGTPTATTPADTLHVFRGEVLPCLNPPVPCQVSLLAGTWTYGEATP